MKYVCLGILLSSWAAVAAAECRPEGRAAFAAGLEALARGDLSVAAAQFGNLVQAQPDCAEARNNLAVVKVEQGQLSEAAEELRVAVRLRPDYERARFNLQRVEALLAREAGPALQPPRAPAAASPTVTLERAAAAATTVAPRPTKTLGRVATASPTTPPTARRQAAAPQPTKTPGLVAAAAPSPPPAAAERAEVPGIVDLEPPGASACAIDPTRQRVCLYSRSTQGVALRACYGFAGVHVAAWPGWLIVGDTGGQRIRLLDETGQRRVKIIPEHANVAGDVVRLRQKDFDSLCAEVRPWRTACVLADSGVQLEPAKLAAVRDALEAWRSAWEQRRFEDYAAQYGHAFVPQSEPDVAHWQARKRSLFAEARSITVQVASLSIFATGDETVIMLFDQRYRSDTSKTHDLKALRWQREAGVWKITAETVLRPNLPE